MAVQSAKGDTMGYHNARPAACQTCNNTSLKLLAIMLLLSCFTGGALAQLPNIRIGLPDNGGDGPRLDTQPGYPIKEIDVPFGERFEVSFKYYNLSDQPLFYRNAPPLDIACCYSFNAYWTANAALHPYWFRKFGLDRMCMQVSVPRLGVDENAAVRGHGLAAA
jgi:hypothetical protein